MIKNFPVISGLILIASLFLAACGGQANPMPGVETVVAATFQALTATQPTELPATEAAIEAQPAMEPQATPEASPAQPMSPEPNVAFEGISFYLDYQLAKSWAYEITSPPDPASDNPFQKPSHYQLDFQEFVVDPGEGFRGWRQPRLYIIPVENMQSFPNGGYLLGSLSQQQQILASRPEVISERMPVVPHDINFNNGEVFHSNLQYLNFQNGSGVRFLAEYSQVPFPVGKGMSYIFQGLTDDGKYYVSLSLPIGQTALDQYNAPYQSGLSDEASYQAFAENYQSYLLGAVGILETTPDASFTPDLARLDELVQSLLVKP